MNIYSIGGDWPSNADIVYLGRSVNAADGIYGSFQPDLVRRAYLGTTPAPKGKVILDIFNRGNNRITASNLIVGKVPDPQLIADITGLIPADLELGRPTNVSFYAGRIFYSGITSQITAADPRSPLLTGAVMYSQLLENLDKLGKCYQEADPTSEEISDLVATDGGIIFIPGAANIVEQTPIGNSLIIFAQTGIWAIQGSEAGFAADDFQVKKVSDIGVLEHESIIALESGVIFWAQNGVYALSLDAGLGSYAVQSLSREKIQTYYNSIPILAKRNAKGYFDAQAQVLMWLFNPNAGPSDPPNEYTHELRFDLTLQAWYLYEYAQTVTSPKIADYASSTLIDQLGLTGVAEPIYAVLEDGATYVVNFASLNDDDLYDWDSINYSSYLRFGSELAGNGFDQKTEMVAKFYFNRTEVEYDAGLELFKQSSAQLTAFWNFSDASSSDAKHGPVEVYKLQRYTSVDVLAPDTPFEYGRDVVMTQERVRGKGMAVDLLLESDENKDLQLLGWTAQFSTDGPDLNG